MTASRSSKTCPRTWAARASRYRNRNRFAPAGGECAAGRRASRAPVRAPRHLPGRSERLARLQPNGARLVYEQSRAPRHLGGDGAIVTEIGHLVGEILADERDLG